MAHKYSPGTSVLVTGGTGSFGNAVVRHLLREPNIEKIVVFSRDEMKQWEMANQLNHDSRLRFFIGDVRDRERLYRAFTSINVVIHAAATKIVPSAEYNPFETIKTNIFGAMNVVDAAIDRGVSRVIALSTDKASSPINLYGATKLVSDKVFVDANRYSSSSGTKFSVVRYGNVMGSRGSIIPLFRQRQAAGVPIEITDSRMTRFMISLEQAIELVELALFDELSGGIYVMKIPSMSVCDIAETVAPGHLTVEIGIRDGEKIHEEMISEFEASKTLDMGGHYVITPSIAVAESLATRGKGTRLPDGFAYRSDSNPEWMEKEALAKWLLQNDPEVKSGGIH